MPGTLPEIHASLNCGNDAESPTSARSPDFHIESFSRDDHATGGVGRSAFSYYCSARSTLLSGLKLYLFPTIAANTFTGRQNGASSAALSQHTPNWLTLKMPPPLCLLEKPRSPLAKQKPANFVLYSLCSCQTEWRPRKGSEYCGVTVSLIIQERHSTQKETEEMASQTGFPSAKEEKHLSLIVQKDFCVSAAVFFN